MTTSTVITLRVTPSGRLIADGDRPSTGPDPIAAAFARGAGHGLLHLGVAAIAETLPPGLAYFRDLARLLIAAICHTPNADRALVEGRIAVDEAALARAADAVPPLPGAEYLDADALRRLSLATVEALRADLAASGETVDGYLGRHNPIWNLVGRAHFHLAENRREADRPFVFLATYTVGLGAGARVQHAPLGQALREYAGARNRQALLSLLAPVQRAAEACGWVKELVDSNDIYHPVGFSPDQALHFLRDIETLEEAGLVVKVPDFWKARRPPRAEVRVTVGSSAPAGLGRDALLDFDVRLAIDGEPLTAKEARQILSATSGLALLRGRWIEVDRAKLRTALDQWQAAERAARDGGISFFEALRLIAGAPLDGGAAPAAVDGARAWSRVEPGPWLAEVLRGLRSPEGLAAADPGKDLRARLRPYQETGVRWLWWLHRLGFGGCLADDMGLGKTIQVIALLLLARRAKAGPSLLVVPASLIANWRQEIERFAPGLRAVVAHRSEHPPEEIDDLLTGSLAATNGRAARADVVITSYGTAARLPRLREVSWDTVVLDEAQAIKNASTKQARACKALPGRVRLALTGTPVENSLGDLWSVLDFCVPGLLGTERQFASFVKQLEAREHDAYAPLRALVRPYVLRRLKTDKSVIADLPAKTEMKAYAGLSRKQAALYADAVADLGARLAHADGIERRGLVLASLMRLKQICNHPSHWLGDGGFAPGDSGKFRRLTEIVDEIAARQERALVFTQFKEMTGPLAAYLGQLFGRAGLVLSGDTAVKKRQRLVDEFEREGGPPFFVLSLRAGGTGLNLTAANHVIHFDRWWNPAVEQQATDRAFRIGQRRNVMVHKLICRGTLEEKIDALIESKKALATEIVASGEEGVRALTELDDQALLQLVSLDVRTALAET